MPDGNLWLGAEAAGDQGGANRDAAETALRQHPGRVGSAPPRLGQPPLLRSCGRAPSTPSGGLGGPHPRSGRRRGLVSRIQVDLAARLRCVEYLEQFGQTATGVRSVRCRAVVKQVEEDVPRLEDAGVGGEQAENDAHQEPFQVVASVTRGFQRIVKPPDQLGGLDVDGVLIAERPALHAEDEAERLYMARQLGEREGHRLPLAKIAKLERLEVADQDVAGAVALGQRVELVAPCSVSLILLSVPVIAIFVS